MCAGEAGRQRVPRVLRQHQDLADHVHVVLRAVRALLPTRLHQEAARQD